MGAKQKCDLDAWGKIRAALEDSRWDFRTIEGISRDTGLGIACVSEQLDQHRSEVRRAVSRDGKGRELYTTKPWPVGFREVIADIHAFASKSL